MLYVGAGKSCIDPYEDMYPMPTRFGICEGKYSSCYCRALAIKIEKKTLLLLAYDLSDRPEIADLNRKILEEAGCPDAEIIIAVTHNHSSPSDGCFEPLPPDIQIYCERYKSIELQAGVSACRKALKALRPAKIGYGTVDSPINVNRDYHTLGGYWVEAPDFHGYSDHTMSILKFVDMEEKLIAVLLNHSTHANMAFLQRDVDGKVKLSGNFPGITCSFLEEYYEDSPVVLWTSGCAGDQNPVMCHGLQLDYPDGYTTQVEYPDGTGYLQMEFIGRRHAVDAIKGIDSITEYLTNPFYSHVIHDVELPRQRSKDGRIRDYRMGEYGLRKPGDIPHNPVVPEMERVPDFPVEVRVELLLIGDIAAICVGAELYNRIGDKLKAELSYEKCLIITHTFCHTDYVVDMESTHHQTFQSFLSIVPGEGEQIILDCVKRMLNEL